MTPRMLRGSPLPLSTIGTGKAFVPYVASLQLDAWSLDHSICLICQTLYCPLPFLQNVAAAQSKWRGTERWRQIVRQGWWCIIRLRGWKLIIRLGWWCLIRLRGWKLIIRLGGGVSSGWEAGSWSSAWGGGVLSGWEAGSWSSGWGGVSSAEFRGTLRALSRSSSDSRRSMISTGMADEGNQSEADTGGLLIFRLSRDCLSAGACRPAVCRDGELITVLSKSFHLLSKPVQALSVIWTSKFQSLREMPRDFSHFMKQLSELVISRNVWNVQALRVMPSFTICL